MLSKREFGFRQGRCHILGGVVLTGPSWASFLSFSLIHCARLPSNSLTLPTSGLFPGIHLPKFTRRAGLKQLLLIGCIFFLIALVVSLIVLCEFNRGSRAGLWSLRGAVGFRDGDTQQGDEWGTHTHRLPCPQRDTPANGLGPWHLQAPWR